MNKIFSFMIVAVFLVSFASAVSEDVGSTTEISGIIYNSDYSQVIEGANVTVNCNGHEKYVISDINGEYNTSYYNGFCASDSSPCSVCVTGDPLTVSAVKGGLFGSAPGTIWDDTVNTQLDFAIVIVSLVPEFGVVVGLMTLLASAGIFFMIRKE